jgi:hypothetical protein
MEAVKSAITQGVQARHGPCVVQLEPSDRCMKIHVRKCPDHIIYVRPNDRDTEFLCHYVHRSDVMRPLCGPCQCRVERFAEPSAPALELDEQPFNRHKRRATGVEPRCLCTSDAALHAWRQCRAFQLVRVVVSDFCLLYR